MAVGCKLWLLAVMCVAFLYQDGPQGNGVLCGRKPAPESYEDHSSGAVSSDDGNDGHDDYSEQNESCNASDGDHTENNHNGSGDEDDYDGGDADKESNSDEEEDHGNNTKKHATNKNSVSCKNQNRHHDEDEDEDGEDNKGDADEKADEDGEDDEEHIDHYKKSTRNNTNEMKIFTTTIITGKPKDILKFLNEGVKPYKPATLDFSKKSNSSLIKKIDTILNRSSLLSKNKKETSEEDLTHYMRHIVEEGTKKKSSKQVDADKLLITLVKGVLLQLLKAV